MPNTDPTNSDLTTEPGATSPEVGASESAASGDPIEQATQPALALSENAQGAPLTQQEGLPTWKTAILVALVAGLAGGMGGVVGGFIGGAAAVKISKPAKHGDESMLGPRGFGERDNDYSRGYGMPGIPGMSGQQGQPNMPPYGMGAPEQQGSRGMRIPGQPGQQGTPDYPTAPRGHENEKEGNRTMPTPPQWNGQGGLQGEQSAPGVPGAPQQP